jgi:hypothetical protein
MKPSEHEKLLKELLPDERLTDFREASLEQGLASLRRHRGQRLLFRTGALAAVACLLITGMILKDRHSSRSNLAELSPHSSAARPDHVKFISDDELLAMFPQGSVALIGKPGQQRLVFLGAPERNTQVRERRKED